LLPVSVAVPPETIKPPAPSVAPSKLPLALVSVKLFAPSATVPLPVNVVIEAPAVVPEISNVPLLATPLDAATLPAPDRASVLPLSTVVAPVKVFTPVNMTAPLADPLFAMVNAPGTPGDASERTPEK